MPAGSPTRAWIAVVAWAGFIAGVGAAMKPEAPAWVDEAASVMIRSAWLPHVAAAVVETPARAQLLVGAAGQCNCDASDLRQLRSWAEQSDLVIHELDDAPAGIALIDAKGQLRYAGEAGALASSCAGLGGFKYWWAPVNGDLPVVAQFTAPCECET